MNVYAVASQSYYINNVVFWTQSISQVTKVFQRSWQRLLVCPNISFFHKKQLFLAEYMNI